MIDNLEEVASKSKQRINSNPVFGLIDENAKRLAKSRDETEVNLEINKYKSFINQRKEEIKKFEK